MKIENILKQYHNEWLLIEVEKFDEDYKPLEGKVIAHSPLKHVIYQKMLEHKGKNYSIEYAGEYPEVAVLL